MRSQLTSLPPVDPLLTTANLTDSCNENRSGQSSGNIGGDDVEDDIFEEAAINAYLANASGFVDYIDNDSLQHTDAERSAVTAIPAGERALHGEDQGQGHIDPGATDSSYILSSPQLSQTKIMGSNHTMSRESISPRASPFATSYPKISSLERASTVRSMLER